MGGERGYRVAVGIRGIPGLQDRNTHFSVKTVQMQDGPQRTVYEKMKASSSVLPVTLG